MTWRLANSLEKLRAQVNAAAPARSKSSDGTVGDAAHASRSSDHNPYIKDGGVGVVRALDLTHDPKGGMDSYALAEALRVSADPRIKYIISNGKIANSGKPWRKYSGSNSHSHHVHVSVNESKALYDDKSDWAIGMGKASVVSRVVAAISAAVTDKPAALKVGSSGDAVRELQLLLGITADGHFGAFTEKAVRAAQKELGLVVDGVAGPYTIEALRKSKPVAKPADDFERVMPWVFEDEGGATVSPDEPGGISTFGVSRTAYSEYLGRAVSIDEMKALTKAQASEFYRARFWGLFPNLPAGLRYAAFDFAINSGPTRAKQYAAQYPTIDALTDARLAYLASLPTAKKYLKGWANRVERVRKRAKTL